MPEASPTTDAWGIEETMPLDEEGWGFDEEIDLDAITLEPPPSAAVVQPAPVVAEPKVEESAADVENRAKQEQPSEANGPPPQAAQPSPAPEPAKADELKIKQETPEPEPLPDVSPTFSDDPWGTNDIKVEEEELPRPPEDVQEGAALQPKTISVDVNGAEVGPEEPDLPEEAAAQDNFNQQLELEPPVHEYQAAQPESAEPASSSATVEPESEESKTGWPDVAEQELAGLDAEPNGAEPADDSPSDDTIIVRPEEVGGETPESADEDAYEQELPVPASLARDAEPNRTPVAPQEGFPRKTSTSRMLGIVVTDVGCSLRHAIYADRISERPPRAYGPERQPLPGSEPLPGSVAIQFRQHRKLGGAVQLELSRVRLVRIHQPLQGSCRVVFRIDRRYRRPHGLVLL
jgi:hypothetical protein